MVEEAACAILPGHLGESIQLFSNLVDGAAVHPLTGWKQSVDAATIALGNDYPDEYLDKSWAELPYVDLSLHTEKEFEHTLWAKKLEPRKLGRDASVSALLFEIMCRNAQRKINPERAVKLHAVGHSYGAKLVTLASLESMRRWLLDKDTPSTDPEKDSASLETLLLLNPAFSPNELKYVKKRGPLAPISIEEVGQALSAIPRKAVVYTSYDYATGFMYNLSQMFFNNMVLQNLQPSARSTKHKLNKRGRELGGRPGEWFSNILFSGVTAFQLGANTVGSGSSWATGMVMNTGADWVYHIRNNPVFGREPSKRNRFVGRPLQYAYNTAHFFVPLPSLFLPGANQTKKGIFRLSKPAIGKTGLNGLTAGRSTRKNLAPIPAEFIGPGSSIGRDEFEAMAEPEMGSHEDFQIDPDLIYSMDAGNIYNSWWNAHSDLRRPENWRKTFFFVHRFTHVFSVKD
jgi:hypothetical protein